MSIDNPFADHELLSPTLSPDSAAAVLLELYGRTGPLTPLGSHQDQNFLADCADGRYVLKISNPGFTHVGLEAQNAAMLHLAERGADFRAPVPLADVNGEFIAQVEDKGRTFDVRLVTFLEGRPLADYDYLAPSVLRLHGSLAARAAKSLADFDHPGLDRILQWDCRHASDVVEALVGHVEDPHRREQVRELTKAATAAMDEVSADLRLGVIHADVTDVNVVASLGPDGRPHPDALIDFGDMLRTWIVSDVAVAAVSLSVHDLSDVLGVTTEIAKGFHAEYPLTEVEVRALWPLVVARAAACCVSSEQQALLEPDNAYAATSREEDWRIWEQVRAVPWA
ncbi:MAG TPA: phosphotransferase, partial [Actinomycetes bacterium]|nr:phosphotransferase [Actinomycetes bacterium]